MNLLNRLYSWYGKRTVLTVILVVVVLILVGVIFMLTGNQQEAETVVAEDTTVIVKQVHEIGTQAAFASVGKVTAISEVRLQTESGGRVVSVNAEIGDTVAAGTIIATIENSAQSAALLQAQGAYEAALASAASSEISVGGAQESLTSANTSAINTYRTSYITADSVFTSTIDPLFSISNDRAIGVRIDAQGQANMLNTERNALFDLLKTWQTQKDITNATSIISDSTNAQTTLDRLIQFIELLTVYTNESEPTSTISQTDLDALSASLYAAQSTLLGTAQGLTASKSAVTNAQKGLEQAQLASQGETVSASSAQIKIALGSLRAAQSAYEKTLVRTPISGVINALYIKEGEYVSPSQQAAIVANNGSLQVEATISEKDAQFLSIGDTVALGNDAQGTITAIAPALDPITSTIAVKIGVTNAGSLTNGSTVSVSFSQQSAESAAIVVPLTALKMTSNGPVAFGVSAENTLFSIPVELGMVTGETVVIVSGLTQETQIVTDARGLKEGQTVVVTQE